MHHQMTMLMSNGKQWMAACFNYFIGYRDVPNSMSIGHPANHT